MGNKLIEWINAGNYENVKSTIENNSELINTAGQDGIFPLFKAMSLCRHSEDMYKIIDLLIEKDAKIDKNVKNDQILYYAAKEGYSVSKLLQKCNNITENFLDACDEKQNTPLHMLLTFNLENAKAECETAINYYSNNSANEDKKSNLKENQYTRAVKNPLCKGDGGIKLKKVLSIIAQEKSNDLECVLKLLKKGGLLDHYINKQNNDNDTLLHLAIKSKLKNCAISLVNNNAKTDIVNIDERKAEELIEQGKTAQKLHDIFLPRIICKENKNSFFPNHLTLASLAFHADQGIIGTKKLRFNKDIIKSSISIYSIEYYLQNWILSCSKVDENKDYRCNVYVNDKCQQVVVAFKAPSFRFEEEKANNVGTNVKKVQDILGVNSVVKSSIQNLSSYIYNNVGDIKSIYENTKYSISFVGNTLGGFQAAQAAFFYYDNKISNTYCENENENDLHKKIENKNKLIQLVTFDSPNAGYIVDALCGNELLANGNFLYDTFKKELKAIQFLTDPDLVNSMGSHIGKRIQLSVAKPDVFVEENKIGSLVVQIKDKCNGIQALKDLITLIDNMNISKIIQIIKALNNTLGYADELNSKLVLNWPEVIFDDIKSYDPGKVAGKAVSPITKHIPGGVCIKLFVKTMVRQISKAYDHKALFGISQLLFDVLTKNMNMVELTNYTNETNKPLPLTEEEDLVKDYNMKYVANYHVIRIKSKEKIVSNKTDELLVYLASNKLLLLENIKVSFNEKECSHITEVLTAFLNSYECFRTIDQEILIKAKDDYNIFQIEDSAYAMKFHYSDIIEKLLNHKAVGYIHSLNKNVGEEVDLVSLLVYFDSSIKIYENHFIKGHRKYLDNLVNNDILDKVQEGREIHYTISSQKQNYIQNHVEAKHQDIISLYNHWNDNVAKNNVLSVHLQYMMNISNINSVLNKNVLGNNASTYSAIPIKSDNNHKKNYGDIPNYNDHYKEIEQQPPHYYMYKHDKGFIYCEDDSIQQSQQYDIGNLGANNSLSAHTSFCDVISHQSSISAPLGNADIGASSSFSAGYSNVSEVNHVGDSDSISASSCYY